MAEIGETELDIGALWQALWRHAWLLAVLAVVAAVGTYVGLGFVTPLYTADTRILIEQRESPLTRTRDDTADTTTAFDESAIQSQVEVLRSREVAEAVIDNLHLTTRPEFDPASHSSIVNSLLVAVGLRGNPTEATIRQRVMESYFERLSVFPLQTSRVIGVEFSASDPDLAAEVANAVADAFVKLQQDAKRESAVAATEWLQQEIERLRGRVADAEQAVSDYRSSHGLFDVDRTGQDTGGNLSTQQLSDINAELARARAARAEAEARADAVQKLLQEGSPLDASEDVLNSPLIQRLREREVALRAQIAELSTTLLPGHPRIRALEGQVANLDGQIRSEAGKVLASLQTAARIAAAREESLLKSLNEAKGDVSRSNDQDIELRALEREATAQRDLLESFLSRYREAVARTDANYLPADARVISRAVAPQNPSFPKKGMMSIAAAIAVLLIASAVVLLREFMSGRAFRVIGFAGSSGGFLQLSASKPEPKPSEIPERPVQEAPTEVQASEAEPEEEEAAFEDEAISATADLEDELDDEPAANAAPVAPIVVDSDSESGDVEAAELAAIIADPTVRLALFAGAKGSEGAGEIAFSAAREAAKEKLRSIVIDIGRRPSPALGYERPGLCDLLGGSASFGEVIQRDDVARVHMIPYGATENAPPMQRMQLAVAALAHSYDKVILVADKLADWPDRHLRPDVAALVCGPETTERLRAEVYETALARGAKSAIIVRYASDRDLGGQDESAAA
jgi:tyrosine-protein kinase Etk/Wzc